MLEYDPLVWSDLHVGSTGNANRKSQGFVPYIVQLSLARWQQFTTILEVNSYLQIDYVGYGINASV